MECWEESDVSSYENWPGRNTYTAEEVEQRDKNGPFENGDFISSSTVPGYGMVQDDDLNHNYTVGKIKEEEEPVVEEVQEEPQQEETVEEVKEQQP